MAPTHFRSRLKHPLRALAALGLGVLALSSEATTVYTSQADWLAAIVPGSASATQTFSSYGNGNTIRNVDLGPATPGVSLDSNTPTLIAIDSVSLGKMAFAFWDTATEVHYVINFATPVSAFAFDVTAWNPASPGPATMTVTLGNGSEFVAHPRKTSGDELDPYFVGLTSAGEGNIRRITWSLSPEIEVPCCEEAGLDNLVVATAAVPTPGGLPLLASALGAWAWRLRRRRA